MNKGQLPQIRSPYRRRRILWSLFLVFVAGLCYLAYHPDTIQYIGSWSLPAYLKDIGSSPSSSRASLVSNAKAEVEAGRLRVQEIHGLLHFVTTFPERRLNEQDGAIVVEDLGPVEVNPDEDVDLRVYAADGDDNWGKHLQTLREEHPLVIFSKSYCPYVPCRLRSVNTLKHSLPCRYSKRAKTLLLETYHLMPHPTVIELDTRTDGLLIQTILARLTGRSTVPNIILQVCPGALLYLWLNSRHLRYISG